jgi:hypothetical protein
MDQGVNIGDRLIDGTVITDITDDGLTAERIQLFDIGGRADQPAHTPPLPEQLGNERTAHQSGCPGHEHAISVITHGYWEVWSLWARR